MLPQYEHIIRAGMPMTAWMDQVSGSALLSLHSQFREILVAYCGGRLTSKTSSPVDKPDASLVVGVEVRS